MKAVFLDRDGTMIVDPPDFRVDSISDLHLFPDTVKALKLLATLDYGVFEVTNQAGIGEGRLSQADFERINNAFLDLTEASGIKLLKIYVCPHKVEDNCACRKPKPLMLLEAAKEFNIDLAQSYVIGDRESDIMAGVNAGTKTILVKTGNEPVTSKEATYTAKDLLEAVQYLAAHS
ncbi:MAG TPA: HAD family hydrolase [Candidatus Saccharimonadales bacterium]